MVVSLSCLFVGLIMILAQIGFLDSLKGKDSYKYIALILNIAYFVLEIVGFVIVGSFSTSKFEDIVAYIFVSTPFLIVNVILLIVEIIKISKIKNQDNNNEI